jgi:hypothetical protein
VTMKSVPFPRDLHDPVALLDYVGDLGLNSPPELRVAASVAPNNLRDIGVGFDVAALDKVMATAGLSLHQRLALKSALSHAGLLSAGKRVA